MRDSIRWFKCKLKPPKNGGHQSFLWDQWYLFQTSVDVYPGFQSQSGSRRLRVMVSADSLLVRHLLTSWWPAPYTTFSISISRSATGHKTFREKHLKTTIFNNHETNPWNRYLFLSTFTLQQDSQLILQSIRKPQGLHKMHTAKKSCALSFKTLIINQYR